jgi:hypothetical protein
MDLSTACALPLMESRTPLGMSPPPRSHDDAVSPTPLASTVCDVLKGNRRCCYHRSEDGTIRIWGTQTQQEDAPQPEPSTE